MKPENNTSIEKNRRGVALICSVAVLALLCFLAISFAKISILSQQIAGHYSEKTQGNLLAEAGLQRAILAIHEEYTIRGFSDWQNTSWIYKGELDKPLAEIADSNLSFYYQISVAGQQLRYRVRVLDANSFLNINEIYQPGLQRMLFNLLSYLGIGVDAVETEKLVQAIIANRPSVSWDAVKEEICGGYHSLDHMRTVLQQAGAGLSENNFQLLAPFLTCHGWANPRAFSRDSTQSDNLAMTVRGPINLNLAPWQVLAAAIAGLRADDGTSITDNLAQKLAQKLVEQRQVQAFDDWERYLKFLKDLGTTSELGLSMAQVELVFIATAPDAHASESYLANKDKKYYTPWYHNTYLSTYQYDKSRISNINTDFCLGAMGVFNIEALGEKTGFGQDAQSLLQVCTRLCDIYQQTSQADFEKSRKSATAAVPPGHAITGPNGPNLVTPGNENNCNDKLGEILQNAKGSLWEIANTPYGFVGEADLEGKPAVTEFYFIAPGGSNAGNYDEMVMLDDLVVPGKTVISYQREITELAPVLNNPNYRVGLWFRYEDHAFRCSTYLVTQLVRKRVPPYWLIYDAPVVVTPGHYQVELETLYQEKALEAAENHSFIGASDAQTVLEIPPPVEGYYKIPLFDKQQEFVDEYSLKYALMFGVASEEQTNIYCQSSTKVGLYRWKKNPTNPTQLIWVSVACKDAEFSFDITPPMLWNYWKWIYEGEPYIVWVEERKEIYNYEEGVIDIVPMDKNNSHYHPFDRARWEKKLEMDSTCHLKEGRIYRVRLQLPTNSLETKFWLDEYQINYHKPDQKFIATGWKTIGEGQDDEQNMGGPLNPWVGSFPLPHKLSSEIVINDREPNIGGDNFQGRFSVNAPQWSLGTILGTGYTPANGQNINVKLENSNIHANGIKIDPIGRPWCNGQRYVTYNLKFQTTAPLSPHWGNLFLFVVVPPKYYYYRKE